MKTFYILILSVLLSVTKLLGQIEIDEFSEAQKLFLNDRYSEALPYYLNLWRSDTTNANINFKVGVCYLNSRSQKSKAIHYFEIASLTTTPNYSGDSREDREAPILVYKLLGDTYHQIYKFDQAVSSYEKFKINYKGKDQAQIDEANWKIEMCKIGKQLSGLATPPIELKKEDLEKNTLYGNYSSAISPDQSKMTFTVQRSISKNDDLNSDDIFYDDRFVSPKKDSIPISIIDPKNKINTNEVTIATSTDGQIILNYRDDKGVANLYTTYLKGNEWTVPERLNRAINPIGWEQEEYVSADGKTLYFTSDRKGGYGGKDIYKCRKLADGSWGKAINLGPSINTPYDEEAPFVLPDGVTLYFSSNGHKTVGHFDILSSSLSDSDNWTDPVVVGFPIDTTHDNVSLVELTNASSFEIPDKKTKKKNKKNKDSNASQIEIGKSNYMVTFTKPKSTPFTIFKGEIKNENGKSAEDVKITIRDIMTGEIFGIYHSENAGKFAFILPPQTNNNITYEKQGYLLTSENKNISKDTTYMEINKPLQLEPVAVNSKTVLNNVFFGPGNATLRSVSNLELKQLSDFLNLQPGVVVEISGSTNLKGSYKVNSKLSQERADEVLNYLIHNGVNKENVIAKGISKSRWNEKREKAEEEDSNQGIELKVIEINSEKNKISTTQTNVN